MNAFELDGEYHFKGPYFARHIPITHGFKYNRKSETWTTFDKEKYDKLVSFITSPDVVIPNKEEIIKKSWATDTDYDPPRPEGLEYRPFQKAGIEWAMERDSALIADPMGLGKTIQAIGTMNAMRAQKVLVICPSSLKLNWFKEIEKWKIQPLTQNIVGKNKGQQLSANVIILNYEKLKQYAERLREIEWDMIVLDEGHRIKNPAAARTKFIVGGTQNKIKYLPMQAKKKLILTGTPLTNKPEDLWTICHWLLPEVFTKQWDFWTRYCDLKPGKFGRFDHSGASNLKELQDLLRSTIMVRRDKQEVLTDLPDISRQVVEMEATAEFKKFIAEEQRALAEARGNTVNLKKAVADAEETGNKAAYNEAVKKLKEGIRLGISQISRVRKETAIAKAPKMIEHIDDVLEQEDKVIVFAHHKEVIQKIKDHYKQEAVVVSGAVSVDDRQKAVEKFQTDTKTRVFVGSMYAAAEGLTLTKARMVIFAELDWVPATIMQAEARAWRIGQENKVMVQHFVLEGSLDANMARKIVDKQNMADAALDVDLTEMIKLD